VITQWAFDVWAGFVGWITGMLPQWDDPSMQAGLGTILDAFRPQVDGLGAWLPWTEISILVPLVLGLYLTFLTVRAIKSFIPTISG
jgi:hypothetical protein